jgi:hypothetical protein
MQMLKKLFTKYFLEVVPSIVATVVGAYIVTHYINAKPEADKPKVAVTAPAETSKDIGKEATGASTKDAGRKAVKAEPEKPAAAPEKPAPEKAEKQDAASERRHQPAVKTAVKPVAPPAEANAQPDERRDANDLARAAIERLRATEPRPAESRAPEAGRVPEPAKPIDASAERGKVNNAVYAPATPSAPPLVQPLPPAVTVMPPPVDAAVAQAKSDDPSRPTPPAEIPSRPLDLRARHDGGSVAEEVVSAAKSMLQAVVPR